jgi:hypothetical protein
MSKKQYTKPSEKPITEKKTDSVNAPVTENKYLKQSEIKKTELLYGKTHFILIGAGLAVLIFGFILMSGGKMPDENTWDTNIIYSFTRITLAPVLVLSGLALVGYALFYNQKEDIKE